MRSISCSRKVGLALKMVNTMVLRFKKKNGLMMIMIMKMGMILLYQRNLLRIMKMVVGFSNL